MVASAEAGRPPFVIGVGLAAWTSSDAFKSALGDAPCGCEQIHRARRATTPDARESLEADARLSQKAWHCPGAGFPEPDPRRPVDLPPECIDALGAAEIVTGLPTTECRTCPRWYAAQSFVAAVCDVHADAENGELESLHGPLLPNVLVEGRRLLRRAIADLREQEHEEFKRKMAESKPSKD